MDRGAKNNCGGGARLLAVACQIDLRLSVCPDIDITAMAGGICNMHVCEEEVGGGKAVCKL